MKAIPEFGLEEVKEWIGSDNLSQQDLLELLTEIINYEYTVEDFRQDVLIYHS